MRVAGFGLFGIAVLIFPHHFPHHADPTLAAKDAEEERLSHPGRSSGYVRPDPFARAGPTRAGKDRSHLQRSNARAFDCASVLASAWQAEEDS